MSTFYLDYVNGDNTNNGSTWALAWKTITGGATAARIAPGDIIRIAKSPDPTSLGQNATWTNLSPTVALTTAVTANIELCATAWTAAANVTASASSTRKEGNQSASLAIGSAFTTGKIGYKELASSTDFSAYQQVSFWIRTSVAISGKGLTLNLCSDTTGDTVVNAISVPDLPATTQWTVVTVDTGGALGSAVQSISLSCTSDPGTPTILIDNIIACKASSSDDSLTLSSLISKNSLATGGTEAWYGIKSINGTTVTLDSDVSSGQGSGRGYCGATETVTTYKRETIKTTMVSSSSTDVQVVQDSGTFAGGNIEFQGGYNTSTSSQDGETFFDGQNGYGNGLYISNKSYVTVNRINCCRYQNGFSLAINTNNTITISNANNNSNYGVSLNSNSYNNTLNVTNANNNASYGFLCASGSYNNTLNVTNANNGPSKGVLISSAGNNTITISNANNNADYGLGFTTCNDNTVTVSTISNGVGGISPGAGTNYLRNSVIGESTEVSGYENYSGGKVISRNHDNTANNHWVFTDGGTIHSVTNDRSGGAGLKWKYTTSSSNRASHYPLRMVLMEVPVNANAQVTVTAYCMKDHATNIAAKLVCRGGQLAGVSSDVTDTKADDTNWEQLSIQFTPTEAGVIEIEGLAYYVAGNSNAYFADVTVSQA